MEAEPTCDHWYLVLLAVRHAREFRLGGRAGIPAPVLAESDSVVLEERIAGTTPVLAVGLSVQEEPPHRWSGVRGGGAPVV